MAVLCVACLTSKLSLLFEWLQEGIEPYLLWGRQSTRPLSPTALASFALDVQWGLPSLPILARNVTLAEPVSCPDSSVQSSRLVGRCFEGVQTVISDGDGCVGSLQRLVRGLKASMPLAGFWVQPEWLQSVGDICWLLWSCYCLLRSSFPCLLHESNFHMLAGQNNRISDPTPSRRLTFHETPVGRFWRLLTSLGGGRCNMLPTLQGCL